MKNNRLFAIAAAAVILFSGCENDFDPQIYGSFTQNNYPKTKSDYISCAMACYIPFINTPVYNMGIGTQTPMTQNDIGVKRVFDTPTDIMATLPVIGFAFPKPTSAIVSITRGARRAKTRSII